MPRTILKDPTWFSFAFFKVSMARALAKLSADGECIQNKVEGDEWRQAPN